MKPLRLLVLPAILLGTGASAGTTVETAPLVAPQDVPQSVPQAAPETAPETAQETAQETAPQSASQSASQAPADPPPTFSGRAAEPLIADPWERYNRGMYSINGKVDKYIARPIGVAYDTVVPDVVQRRVTSFFANLKEPRTMVNQLLQGRPGGAATTLGRFVVNTTAGIGGIFDPASALALKPANEDFGQTLAVWGWEDSRYFVAPMQGPGTLRDFAGGFGDRPLNPAGYIDDSGASAALAVLQLGSVRSGAFGLDKMRELAVDEYAMVRDMWVQRRKQQIADR